MMEGLFEISSRGEGLFEATLRGDHAVFAGHFPGKAVLPGVCTLAIVRECASLVAGVPLRYAGIGESKFLAVITPEMALTVELTVVPGADGGDLRAVVRSGPEVMLKLRATVVRDE